MKTTAINPTLWAGRPRFVIGATGFGLGRDFLATWQAWREDPARCDRLVYLAVVEHAPQREDLTRAHLDTERDSGVDPPVTLPPVAAELAQQLIAAWPPLTPNLHVLDFEGGRVRLLLSVGEVRAQLRQWVARVDAFLLDGLARKPAEAILDRSVFKSLARLAAPQATAITTSNSVEVRVGLESAGFTVVQAPVSGAERSMSFVTHAPRHRGASPPGGLHTHEGPREALVIGAGLAGCAAASALGREGWSVTVIDRAAGPASAGSGQALGLFHSVVHRDDGPHARAHRAAALRTAAVLGPWIATGRVRGSIDGLLRMHDDTADPALHAAFVAGHAQAVEREAARALSGLPLAGGGVHFVRGGWVVPGEYARALLDESGARFVGGFDVQALQASDDVWEVRGQRDGAPAMAMRAPVLVIATAQHLGALLDPALAAALGPLASVRGQLSAWPQGGSDGLDSIRPRMPISGQGYLAPALDGRLWFGATSQPGDMHGAVRDEDHRQNLARLAALIGQAPLADVSDEALRRMVGRVGWRAVTPDRLPWIGALPDLSACAVAIAQGHRLDAPRLIPRLRDARRGLHVLGGLGSRGIAWAALGGELLASWAGGSPCPLEADLRDALDPARTWLRAQRRSSASLAQASSKPKDS